MFPSAEDNLGRRRFLLYRDKAVEQARERIRRAPDSGWETLTYEQRTGLGRVLAEIWESCERVRWQQYCFSTLNKADILRLIALGDEMRARHQPICVSGGEVEAILLTCSTGDRLQ